MASASNTLSNLTLQAVKQCWHAVYVEYIFTHDVPWSGHDKLDIRHSTKLVLAIDEAHLVAGKFHSTRITLTLLVSRIYLQLATMLVFVRILFHDFYEVNVT